MYTMTLQLTPAELVAFGFCISAGRVAADARRDSMTSDVDSLFLKVMAAQKDFVIPQPAGKK